MKIEKPYGLHRPSDPPNQQPAGVFRSPPEPPHHRPPLLSQPPTMPSWRQPPFTIDSLLRPVLLLQEPTTGHPSSPSRRPCLPTTASVRPFPPLTSHPSSDQSYHFRSPPNIGHPCSFSHRPLPSEHGPLWIDLAVMGSEGHTRFMIEQVLAQHNLPKFDKLRATRYDLIIFWFSNLFLILLWIMWLMSIFLVWILIMLEKLSIFIHKLKHRNNVEGEVNNVLFMTF